MHAAALERARQTRQPYRAAYFSSAYRSARRERLAQAGGRCEAILPDGTRCQRKAEEVHHVVPLSQARSCEEAELLCTPSNLRAVCRDHHPRGGG